MGVKIDLTGFESDLYNMVIGVVHDKTARLEVANMLYKKMDPYVPMDQGTLAQTVEIDENKIRYLQPYAHYMYEGIVYGPNIPIIENGMVVGFFSRPGMKKTPTGAMIEYSKEFHPKATSHWDEVMMQTEGDSVKAEVANIFVRRMKEL